MKHWVWIRAEIKNEIAVLEKSGKENEMRPSICGKAHNQIWQRRISRVPLGTQKKRVWISPYTLFSSAAYVARIGRAAFGVPLALTHA